MTNVPPGAAGRARALLGDFTEGRWEHTRGEFHDNMRGHVDSGRIAHGWDQTASSAGGVKRIGSPSARQFGDYARSWIEERPGLRPKTIQLYRYLLRRHLLPAFVAWPVCDIREPHVRRWRKQLLDAGTSPVTVAKAYRLFKAIMNTAADDGMITRNPCRIKGQARRGPLSGPSSPLPRCSPWPT